MLTQALAATKTAATMTKVVATKPQVTNSIKAAVKIAHAVTAAEMAWNVGEMVRSSVKEARAASSKKIAEIKAEAKAEIQEELENA